MATAGAAIRRDRTVALAGLLGLAGLAWLYLWMQAGAMGAMPMDGMDMPTARPWSVHALLLTFLMWTVMMAGMMLPSAAPAILLYASIVRKNREAGSVLPAAWIFTAGYLAVWTAFSLGATGLQAALQSGRLLTPSLASASAWLTGLLLITAGIYQWLPIKDACLNKCRAPLQFFLFHWRPGGSGAFRMGARHGLFCVGCCWALMLLLFAAGVMNLLWVAVIAAFVLLEKLGPGSTLLARSSGVAMALTGAGIIAMA